MICAGIVNQTIIGPFKFDKRVKLNSANYCDFTDNTFFAWYMSRSRSFKVKCIFMYDNACYSKLIHEFFEPKKF